MSGRDDIARLEERNRNLKAMIDDAGERNKQSAKGWQAEIERNLISIERAKAIKE
jgi:hypothetical protein